MTEPNYPQVVSEDETLDAVLSGQSIARYGDGEFNIIKGQSCVSQLFDKRLQRELRSILHSKSPRCIVGIPNLDPRSPKIDNWLRVSKSYGKFLKPKKRYYSSFITRPDSAPWIWNQVFFDKVESLWRGQEIALVYGSSRSLTAEMPEMESARKVHPVFASYRDSYTRIDQLEQAVIATGVKRAILCVGPCATALAYRLSERGVHAIDLGHIGRQWYDPTRADKYATKTDE